MAAHVLTSAI